jgi:methylated-DNA-protein-cysteine methyltransferase-like protein
MVKRQPTEPEVRHRLGIRFRARLVIRDATNEVYRRRKTAYHGDYMRSRDTAYARILRAVATIPRGRVASYGQIAAIAGLPGRARQVGFALRNIGDGAVPWHRVVNARGTSSLTGDAGELQRRRLRREGVAIDDNGRIDLARFGLGGSGRTRAKAKR